VAANAIIGYLALRTIALLVQGRLLPAATPSR
jgi:tellurite resistance protein